MIAVSEGIIDASGTPAVASLLDSVEKDADGNVQLSGNTSLGDALAENRQKAAKYKKG